MIHVLAASEQQAKVAANTYAWGRQGVGYKFLASMTDIRWVPKGAEVVKVGDWDQNPAYRWQAVNDLLQIANPKVVRWVPL